MCSLIEYAKVKQTVNFSSFHEQLEKVIKYSHFTTILHIISKKNIDTATYIQHNSSYVGTKTYFHAIKLNFAFKYLN